MGLQLVGVATIVVGLAFATITVGLGPRTAGDVELRILSGALAAATVTAGVLTLFRLREDLVGSVLGAFTAGAFTIAIAQSTRATADWSLFYPAATYGGLLFGFLAFRGAFRTRRD